MPFVANRASVPMPDPLLSISSAEVDIDGSRILRGVTLEVRPNELVALMGRNGVGKTTTLRALMGLRPLRSGVMTLGGTSLAGLTSDGRARAGLGYVPQGRDIFPHLTVEENLRISLVVHRIKSAAAREAIDEVYTLFPILKQFVARKGGVLSGGQQQQLAIGRALLTKPKVLLLDEPTEGIQPSIIEEIGDTLKKLRASGRLSILLVEQYVDFCRAIADRFYAMDRGAVTISGPISELTDEVVQKHLQV
ncbi:MAG: urea ABC transporter ATP-binding subunit UrtE [Verrucomicrobia bacterium]|nr:MAG: urea ABC transporter ATP-binding subunit UrtE [Verrucomicrobiota bacterium]